MKKSIMAIGVILLFIGMAFIPMVNAEETQSIKPTNNNSGRLFLFATVMGYVEHDQAHKEGFCIKGLNSVLGLAKSLEIDPFIGESFTIGDSSQGSDYFGGAIFIGHVGADVVSGFAILFNCVPPTD